MNEVSTDLTEALDELKNWCQNHINETYVGDNYGSFRVRLYENIIKQIKILEKKYNG